MTKHNHEFRDPVHVFVRLDTDERRVVDSRSFQRLRDIHQLAMTYLVYPGATHRRFEHSLGVMELATRVYNVVTDPRNLKDYNNTFSEIVSDRKRLDWLSVLRMAALLHDIGHLPFSHAAEKELLPEGWTHETLTKELILSTPIRQELEKMDLQAEKVVKIALGPEAATDFEFSPWETILAEIIVGDAFGVDRMDYLLRDSLHTGVAYGRFDHYRLIDTMRILKVPPPSPGSGEEDKSGDFSETSIPEPSFALGVEEGGLQSSEAMMLARYFMFSQMYFHPIRRIYDIHLKDFLAEMLDGGRFSTDTEKHLSITDAEILAKLHEAARDVRSKGHLHAKRIIDREHFKMLYERNPDDQKANTEAGKAVYEALCDKFGADKFRHDSYRQKGGPPNYPVQMRDDSIVSSLAISEVLKHLPLVSVDYIFADREVFPAAEAWLKKNRKDIIKPILKEAENGKAT
ncbi:MAG: HD domain-containing protein [Desulfatibacillaceae bacterium]|nr:HD domain-containing protein [Desulfatibacillaceae bacterium]